MRLIDADNLKDAIFCNWANEDDDQLAMKECLSQIIDSMPTAQIVSPGPHGCVTFVENKVNGETNEST